MLCFGALLCLPAVPRAACAQTSALAATTDALKTPMTLQQKDVSFDEALKTLHAAGHINVLVDGEPRTQHADVNADKTVREALNAVCDAFDYKWTLSKSGIVLLTKRFKNSEERPQMRYAEMVQMAKDIRDALSLSPVTDEDASPNATLKQLLKSLTPEQYAALTGPKTHPFYARDLRPGQYQMFVQSLWSFGFPSAYNGADLLLRQLESFPASSLFADPQNIQKEVSTSKSGQIIQEQEAITVSHLLRDRSGQRMITLIDEPLGARGAKKP